MAEKTTSSQRTLVDPNFYVPEELDGIVREDFPDTLDPEEEFFAEGADGEEIYFDEELEETEDDTIAEDEEIPVPEEITVVSQTTRTSTSGAQVVDVVIQIEDLYGVQDYEVRIAK